MAIWYGRLATSFPGAGSSSCERKPERVAEDQLDVPTAAQPLAQVRLQGAIELHRVHRRDTVGEVHGQNSQAGADLEHDVGGVELGEPARDAEDVLVHEEVLAELAVGRDGEVHSRAFSHGRPNRAAALASTCASSSAASTPRASAATARVCTTYAGSFRFPRTA